MNIEYKWSELHAEIFKQIIDKFKKNDIEYFILRNYEGLPETNLSKDVDIIIKPGQYMIASQLLKDILKNNKISNYYSVKYERVRCWFGIDLEKDFSIHIDLIEGYLNKGFEIFQFDELYRNCIEYNGMTVLNSTYDALMLLLYKVIGCKDLKERYRKKISDIYEDNKEEFYLILNTIIGSKLSLSICACLDNKNYEKILEISSILSKKSKLIALKKHPFRTIKNIISFFNEKIYKIIINSRKWKKMIVVQAPDGAGKSTFIEALSVRLCQMFVCDIEKMHIYHFRPTIIPNLGEIGERYGVMEQDKNFNNPHRNKAAGLLSSLLRMIYYWVDYVIGGIICIRKDVQFDKFTIFDRYIYDFIIDPIRSRIELPKWIRVAFSKLVVKPNIGFALIADSSVIYSRKQELTIEEINTQLVELKEIVEKNNFFYSLDANKSVDEIVDEAIYIILDKFTTKNV